MAEKFDTFHLLYKRTFLSENTSANPRDGGAAKQGSSMPDVCLTIGSSVLARQVQHIHAHTVWSVLAFPTLVSYCEHC